MDYYSRKKKPKNWATKLPWFSRDKLTNLRSHTTIFIANILTFLFNEFIISHSNVLPEKFSQNFRQKIVLFFFLQKIFSMFRVYIFVLYISVQLFWGEKIFAKKL